VKGVRAREELEIEEKQREKELTQSPVFKKHMKSLMNKPVMSERQYKKQFLIMDGKCTKEFIREEMIENTLYNREKLKVK
jgi:fructose-bisphosphate aldolase class 1